jgi:hypothetical protein
MEIQAAAMESILKEHLPDELATVNAKYATIDLEKFGSSLDLDPPAGDCFYFGPQDAIPVGDYPAIVIIPLDDDRRQMRKTYQIEIWFSDHRDHTARAKCRYAEAIANILDTHKTLDGAAKMIAYEEFSFFPGKVQAGDAFFQVGAMPVTLMTYNRGS